MTSSWTENGLSPSHSLEVAREADTYRNDTIELHHVPHGHAADANPKLRFADRRHLIRHTARRRSKTICLAWTLCDAEQRQICRVRREGTDGHGNEQVECTILENHDWARLAGVIPASCHGPDFAAAHQNSMTAMESMKAWSSPA